MIAGVPPRRQNRTEFAVRYRRSNWVSAQSRMFQSRPPADRFVRKLYSSPSRYAPLEFVVVESREVGPWSIVSQW